jgi:5'-3' exonuclease
MVSNVILVDSSYTSFHRFFATLRWFSLAHMDTFKKYKDDPSYDWSLEPIFIDKYKKMYLESIIRLVSPKVFEDSKIIFCLDSPQETLWRKELSSCYKGNRVNLSEKTNFIPTFKLTYTELIPNLVKQNNNIYSIKKARIEADDIIALAVRYIKDKRPSYNVYLVSGDNDFLQLGYDKLYFADYKKKDLIQLTREEAKEALKQKIINGDCSDNIPSIFPKSISVNNKRKKLIREDKKELKKYLSENKEAFDIYSNNIRLINFRYIPKNLKKPIYTMLKKIL